MEIKIFLVPRTQFSLKSFSLMSSFQNFNEPTSENSLAWGLMKLQYTVPC